MKRLFLLSMIMAFLLPVSAQSIKRHTLGSIGSSVTVGDFRVTSSFGQKSIACSVVYGEGIIVRQGFQQPTGQHPCEFTVGSAWEEIETECGFYYAFEYQGDADLDAASFEWSFGEDAFPEISNTTNPMDVAYATAGEKTIRLTVEQDGCTDIHTFILDAQAASFGASPLMTDNDCLGAAEGEINFNLFGGAQPFLYRWDDGSEDAVRTNLPAGDYPYTVTSSDGCAVTGTATIMEPADGLQLSGVMTQNNCETSNVNEARIDLDVEGATGALEFLWSNGETTEDLSDLDPGTYMVTVFDAGCNREMLFIIEGCSSIEITEVLTPNGDGENDDFVVPGIEDYPNNNMEIYNRWGNIIYSTRGYLNDWNGTNNKGASLVTGAYYYVINLNDEAGTVYGGSVTIVR
jgi:gliding motility-associated-like protein